MNTNDPLKKIMMGTLLSVGVAVDSQTQCPILK
jgi:hypothetical protein